MASSKDSSSIARCIIRLPFHFLIVRETSYNQAIAFCGHPISLTAMNSSGVKRTRSQRWFIAAIAGMTIGIFVLDSFFPLGFVVPALYLIPITLTARVRYSLAPFVVAVSSTGLTFAGIWTNWTSPVVSLQLGLFNRLLVVLACWMTATIIWYTTQKYAREELEALVAARTAALRQSETTLQSFFNSTDLMMGVIEVIEDRRGQLTAKASPGMPRRAMLSRAMFSTAFGVQLNALWSRV